MKNITAIFLLLSAFVFVYSQNSIGITLTPQIADNFNSKTNSLGLGIGGIYQHALSDKVKIESGLLFNVQQGGTLCDSISGGSLFSICYGDKRTRFASLQLPLLLKLGNTSKPSSFTFGVGIQGNYFMKEISALNDFTNPNSFFLRGIATIGMDFRLSKKHRLQTEIMYARLITKIFPYTFLKRHSQYNYFGVKLSVLKET